MAGPDDKKFKFGERDGEFGSPPKFLSEREQWALLQTFEHGELIERSHRC